MSQKSNGENKERKILKNNNDGKGQNVSLVPAGGVQCVCSLVCDCTRVVSPFKSPQVGVGLLHNVAFEGYGLMSWW